MKINTGRFGSITKYWQLLIIISLLLLGITGYTWWKNVYSTPDAVFKRMLASSLQTRGFTRITSQAGSGQVLDITSSQTTAPYHQVRAVNILKQGEQTTITTENITTTNKNFVRYLDIKTDQGRADGTPFDFSQIIGQWGEVPATESDNSVSSIYTSNVVVPLANLSSDQQEQLLQQIIDNGVYELDYQTIRTEWVEGRKTYVYDVTVHPVPYIKMLKALATMLGQGQLDSIDPEQYAGVEPLQFEIYADVLSSHLVRVVYADQAQTTEYYTGYGRRDVAPLPEGTIPLSELQTRLQQLQ